MPQVTHEMLPLVFMPQVTHEMLLIRLFPHYQPALNPVQLKSVAAFMFSDGQDFLQQEESQFPNDCLFQRH